MDSKYISCIIIGHGSYITEFKNNVIDTINIEIPIEIMLGTFATPTETCAYPEDLLIQLKDRLVQYSNDPNITDENINNTFQQLINQAQIDSSKFRYSDLDWAGEFSKKPFFTENWISGYNYVEKEYKKCPETEIQCATYILKNNVGINIGTSFTYNSITLTDMINYFIENFGINKIYIFDATCSIVKHPNGIDRVTDFRTLNRIRRNIIKFFSGGNKENKLKKHITKKYKKIKKYKKTKKQKNIKNKKT
jgi:hypothetical protein